MPKRDANTKAARKLQGLVEGLGYQKALKLVRAYGYDEALRRARAGDTATEPAAPEARVTGLDAVTAAFGALMGEVEITDEELGVRALPDDATPEQRAHAEAVWRPDTSDRPCRCSGTECLHGQPCREHIDEECTGRLIHTDRHPGSMWGLTDWYDTYQCDDCGAPGEVAVKLPDLPWGEVRNRGELDGTERTLSDGSSTGPVIVIYRGVRHPNFPDSTPEEDDGDELDPDAHPTPEEEWNAAADQADEEHQEDGLDDEPRDDVDPIEPPEDYDDGPDEDELGPSSRVPAVDLDPQRTATDWIPEDNGPW
ncbi:hypothetical protein AB0G54_37195 [Streptomyces yokosukanensis]|uniref:hypothetical protein n=1 Tax=Streptomyces yokosukanensis TaxID=67386 RepID=UPI00341CC835